MCVLSQQVALKNFSAEVRATSDIRNFLDNTYLVLDLQESDPEAMVDVLLRKMLSDVSESGIVDEAMSALFTHGKSWYLIF